MSVRKRTWVTSKGEPRDAWIVDCLDQQGERHIETFARKKEADARHAEVRVDVKAGVHVAPSKSITVKEAGASWIKAAEAHGLERSTIKQSALHLRHKTRTRGIRARRHVAATPDSFECVSLGVERERQDVKSGRSASMWLRDPQLQSMLGLRFRDSKRTLDDCADQALVREPGLCRGGSVFRIWC